MCENSPKEIMDFECVTAKGNLQRTCEKMQK